MDNGLGKQGSRSGNTHSERLAKARSGAFAGKKYPEDASLRRTPPEVRMAGQGSSVVKKTPLNPSSNPKTAPGNPWARPDYQKPGAF